MKSVLASVFTILTATALLVACGEEASKSTQASRTALTPAERCNSLAYTTWEAQRRCLNVTYQELIDDCFEDFKEDQSRRNNCIQIARYRLNLHNSSDYFWDRRPWSAYDRGQDPYYSLDAHRTADLWRLYYQQAINQQNLAYYRLLWNSNTIYLF